MGRDKRKTVKPVHLIHYGTMHQAKDHGLKNIKNGILNPLRGQIMNKFIIRQIHQIWSLTWTEISEKI